MERLFSFQLQDKWSRRLPWLVISLTLAFFAVAIVVGTLHLRKKIRAQIVARDAEILHAVALMQQISKESGQELGGQIENFADQFAIALQISELKGVIAARLYDSNGQFTAAFPASVLPGTLTEADSGRLQGLQPLSRFFPAASLADVFLEGSQPPGKAGMLAPLLEVTLPLHRQHDRALQGSIQFIIDGQSIADQFAALDEHLWLQSSLIFLTCGGLTVVTLGSAFRRLRQANVQLTKRTASLLQANEELALAAKTSAVGAITAHLIHGLTNPLAGLENYVSSRGTSSLADSGPEWQEAIATTTRMRAMLAQIVRVLGEESSVAHYDLDLPDLVAVITAKMQPVADAAKVRIHWVLAARGTLSNRVANLILLMLENLIQNAVQASPAGQAVRVTIKRSGSMLDFEVADNGAGFPESLKESLFAPCRSTKEGGNGIGLAICKQLANHLNAGLELRNNSPTGCVFTLSLPAERFLEEPPPTPPPSARILDVVV